MANSVGTILLFYRGKLFVREGGGERRGKEEGEEGGKGVTEEVEMGDVSMVNVRGVHEVDVDVDEDELVYNI